MNIGGIRGLRVGLEVKDGTGLNTKTLIQVKFTFFDNFLKGTYEFSVWVFRWSPPSIQMPRHWEPAGIFMGFPQVSLRYLNPCYSLAMSTKYCCTSVSMWCIWLYLVHFLFLNSPTPNLNSGMLFPWYCLRLSQSKCIKVDTFLQYRQASTPTHPPLRHQSFFSSTNGWVTPLVHKVDTLPCSSESPGIQWLPNRA